MRILLSVICLGVLVLGVQSADKSTATVAAVESKPTDNSAASSSSSTAAAAAATNSKTKKRSNDDEEHIAGAETQHQYDDRHIPAHHSRGHQPQQLITQSEYLALIRDAERSAAAQESSTPNSYGKLSASPEHISAAYYSRNPSHPHPLAGSSLEKEIEKLVSSNSQQYAHSSPVQSAPIQQAHHHHAHHHQAPQAQHSHQHHTESPQSQNSPHQQPQLIRAPVVFKNHNDVVFIPYQNQQIQTREPYGRPGSAITKAKVMLISPYPRAPYPSEAIEYVPAAQPATPPQYAAAKPQESFKELYIQQQRENQLKRLQSQQQHSQAQPQHLANDNLNLQSHAQPLSISLLPKKATPPPPQIVPESAPVTPQIAQLAERLFKTPLEQQKPLTQAEFKALVAAGYPVQAVPVPVAITKAQLAAQNSYPQRYAPSMVSLSHPQPFTHPTKQVHPVVQLQYQQQTPVHHPTAHHQQRPHSQPQHRFYPHPAQYSQPAPASPNTHTTYSVPSHAQQQNAAPAPSAEHGQYTYVLQPGENEESAAEQLRQQIIQEINAQQQKGVPSAATTRVEYQQKPQTSASAEPKPLTEEQKEYYKRLEYYSHNQ